MSDGNTQLLHISFAQNIKMVKNLQHTPYVNFIVVGHLEQLNTT